MIISASRRTDIPAFYSCLLYTSEEIWKTKEMLARDIVPSLKAFKALDKHVYPMGGGYAAME